MLYLNLCEPNEDQNAESERESEEVSRRKGWQERARGTGSTSEVQMKWTWLERGVKGKKGK